MIDISPYKNYFQDENSFKFAKKIVKYANKINSKIEEGYAVYSLDEKSIILKDFILEVKGDDYLTLMLGDQDVFIGDCWDYNKAGEEKIYVDQQPLDNLFKYYKLVKMEGIESL